MKKILCVYLTVLLLYVLSGCTLTKMLDEEPYYLFNKECSGELNLDYINFSYFPKYIRVETVNGKYDENNNLIEDGFVQINEKLVEAGAEYAPGEPVLDIMARQPGMIGSYYAIFFGPVGYYKFISERSVINKLGIDYYEFDGNIERISKYQIDRLKVFYKYCGFTIDKLAEELEYFQNLMDEKSLNMNAIKHIPGDISIKIKQSAFKNIPLPIGCIGGYKFIGWEYNEEVFEKNTSSLLKNYELNPILKPLEFEFSYVLDGGINHPDNPTTYTWDDVIKLKDAYKIGYTFKGWRINGTIVKIDGSEINGYGNYRITAYAIFEKDEE